MLLDPIVAVITGPGPSPVAGVRLSGAGAWQIAAQVLPGLATATPRTATYGSFVNGDDGLGILFDAASYTGEESAELFFHGSLASRRSILDACRSAGARMARPGEFTERAFLNGRIDLTQAEAVRDTIEAQTERQLKHANALRDGALRSKVSGLRAEAESCLAQVEATVDFSEEIGELDRPELLRRVGALRTQLAQLAETENAGRLLREGIRIAIVGRPNVGKSSLLNRILGSERAIVTEVAGTTRDTLEEAVEIAGFKCVLVDTAGLRETEDLVESLGVERSNEAIRTSDVVWFVFDASIGWTTDDQDLLTKISGSPQRIANKVDLGQTGVQPGEAIPVSAKTGQGLEDLYQSLEQYVPHADSVTISSRCAVPLGMAIQALDEVATTLNSDLPDDLAAVGLREAISALGEIDGATAGEDLLDRIFHDFCVGK